MFKHNNQVKILTLTLIIVMISWGLSWASAKSITNYAHPINLIFWRFCLSALGLVPILLYFKNSWKLSLHAFVLAIGGGGLIFLYNYAFFSGLHTGVSGLGAVIVTTFTPIIVFISDSLCKKSKLLNNQIIGLGIRFFRCNIYF